MGIRRVRILQKCLFSIGPVDKELYALLNNPALGSQIFKVQATAVVPSNEGANALAPLRASSSAQKYTIFSVTKSLYGATMTTAQ